ncbi:GIY-YIG nuclease family protein [Candidatus Falkowbacteria bacterium]|jgi:excinuclease ABC subunit C|nr:GIY-YIG nuclease family protein [Candidatus Falkowbacteria bacterium]
MAKISKKISKIDSLKSKLKTVPESPGIYFWYDKKGVILYIGRSNNLKNRLSQYFQKNISPRIAEMLALATDVKYKVTETLLEAIILEAKNIKKFWPKYNIVDRDDRSFIYLIIPKTSFAKPLIVRGSDLKKIPTAQAKIFGPYQSVYLLQSALRLLRRIFPYGNCTPHSGKACFDYQIGLCPGGCIDAISAKDYQKNIDSLCLLLAGEKKRLITKLMKENPNKIKALRHIQDVSLLIREDNLREVKINRLEGYDISHHAGKESYGAMAVFENGEANKNEYRLFKIKEAPGGDDERALAEVLLRRFKHSEWPKPDIIMIDGGSPQISFLSKVFKKNNITVPIVGISKLAGDKLVFPAGTKKELKELAENIKATLLKLREEAHRFANYGRRRAKS